MTKLAMAKLAKAGPAKTARAMTGPATAGPAKTRRRNINRTGSNLLTKHGRLHMTPDQHKQRHANQTSKKPLVIILGDNVTCALTQLGR